MEKKNFTEQVYNAIKNSKKKVVTEQFVFATMGMKTAFDMQAIRNSLNELVKSDRIVKSARGKFMLSDHSSFVRAKIIGTKSGYAFARLENPDKPEDIYIGERNLNGAAHGDTVLISIDKTPNKDRRVYGSRRTGNVEKIVQRGTTRLVGLFDRSGGTTLVIPDDQRFSDCIFIDPSQAMNAKHNDKVVIEILDYPSRNKMAFGKVVEVLGDSKDKRVTTLSIVRSYNLIEEFPPEVLKEAEKVAHPITPEERKGRKDFTNDLVITIDGDDARDFDDAISVEKKGDKYALTVHIADVSHYVKQDSELDKEAFRRGTSVYFPDYVLPMLPTVLSNGMCSLNPHEDRLTLSVEMLINKSGEVESYNITKGVINSKYRMTYKNVTKILDNDREKVEEYKEIVPMLKSAEELARILVKRRDLAGQLDFDLPEPEIIVDENYNTVDIVRAPREMSNRMIEQFMVLTNEVVAKHFHEMNMPFVYRVHETPTQEKSENFANFATTLGLKLGKGARPRDYQKLLLESHDKPYSSALSKIMLRSMQKARYSSEDLGHFGLALRDYCHFTSPIRRYPDLTIHRIISSVLEGSLTDKKLMFFNKFVEIAADQSSETERTAEQAERTVDDQKKAEFMADKIGNEYDAIVSGANENGIFVELANTVEGMVAAENLAPDRYMYDPKQFALVGRHHIYRIGDQLKVKLEQVDVESRHIDFALANQPSKKKLIEKKQTKEDYNEYY